MEKLYQEIVAIYLIVQHSNQQDQPGCKMVSKKERKQIDDLVDIDYDDLMDNPHKLTYEDTKRDEKNLKYFKEHLNESRKMLRKKKSAKSKTKRKQKGCGCK